MSKQSKMTGADYLLLLLYLDNCSAINGAIRITKMMFLFNMEIAPVLKKKGVSIRDEDLPIIFLKASLNTILRIKIIKHSLVISKSTEQLNHRQ